MQNDIPNLNIFMMCESLNYSALSDLPNGYYFRNCKKDELDIWKAMPFDDAETASEYYNFMTDYFNDVYAEKGDLFFDKCIFVCNKENQPIGTCFAWKAYNTITTIHWWKVSKDYEGRGIGRALLSHILRSITPEDFPVFLHTQPESFRAIKLYADFGFSFLEDKMIGHRKNHYFKSVPVLKELIPEKFYVTFTTSKAPEFFLKAVASSLVNQF